MKYSRQRTWLNIDDFEESKLTSRWYLCHQQCLTHENLWTIFSNSIFSTTVHEPMAFCRSERALSAWASIQAPVNELLTYCDILWLVARQALWQRATSCLFRAQLQATTFVAQLWIGLLPCHCTSMFGFLCTSNCVMFYVCVQYKHGFRPVSIYVISFFYDYHPHSYLLWDTLQSASNYLLPYNLFLCTSDVDRHLAHVLRWDSPFICLPTLMLTMS